MALPCQAFVKANDLSQSSFLLLGSFLFFLLLILRRTWKGEIIIFYCSILAMEIYLEAELPGGAGGKAGAEE